MKRLSILLTCPHVSHSPKLSHTLQYLEPETEAAADTSPQQLAQMPADWPQHGAIELHDLHMRCVGLQLMWGKCGVSAGGCRKVRV